jgi:hypothetical protein
MIKRPAEYHHKAAEHHEHAARHHKDAAKHHESGNHEKAAHDALLAQGHSHHATYYECEAAKSYVEQMRAVEAPFANRPQRARAETGRRPRQS